MASVAAPVHVYQPRQPEQTALHQAVREHLLTVPVPLRYLLAYNADIYADVIGAFLRAVFTSLKHRAKRELKLDTVAGAHVGGICFVQRFGSSGANLHPHLHALATDGAFIEEDGELHFRALPEPTRAELDAIAWSACQHTVAVLRKRGLWLDADPADDLLATQQPLLAALAAASLAGTLLFGNQGQRPMRLFGAAARAADHPRKQKNAYGFDLDASVRIPAHDRKRLERLR